MALLLNLRLTLSRIAVSYCSVYNSNTSVVVIGLKFPLSSKYWLIKSWSTQTDLLWASSRSCFS